MIGDPEFRPSIKDPEKILGNFRSKVPPLPDLTKPNPHREEVRREISSKFNDLLKGYPTELARQQVVDLVEDTVTTGCLAFDIDPVELILRPKDEKQGDNVIAAADRKVTGPLDIKLLFIDPAEIMLRIQLFSRSGNSTSKNITDIIFVMMHEMEHLGQAIYAEDDYKESKQFDHAHKPSEAHANEMALAYCRQLLDITTAKLEKAPTDDILLQGLPATIKDIEENGKPSM